MIVYEGGEHLGLQKTGQKPKMGLNLNIEQCQISDFTNKKSS